MVTWDDISAFAGQHGATSEAQRKWRERGCIPSRWKITILQHFPDLTPGAIDALFADEARRQTAA